MTYKVQDILLLINLCKIMIYVQKFQKIVSLDKYLPVYFGIIQSQNIIELNSTLQN